MGLAGLQLRGPMELLRDTCLPGVSRKMPDPRDHLESSYPKGPCTQIVYT